MQPIKSVLPFCSALPIQYTQRSLCLFFCKLKLGVTAFFAVFACVNKTQSGIADPILRYAEHFAPYFVHSDRLDESERTEQYRPANI